MRKLYSLSQPSVRLSRPATCDCCGNAANLYRGGSRTYFHWLGRLAASLEHTARRIPSDDFEGQESESHCVLVIHPRPYTHRNRKCAARWSFWPHPKDALLHWARACSDAWLLFILSCWFSISRAPRCQLVYPVCAVLKLALYQLENRSHGFH